MCCKFVWDQPAEELCWAETASAKGMLKRHLYLLLDHNGGQMPAESQQLCRERDRPSLCAAVVHAQENVQPAWGAHAMHEATRVSSTMPELHTHLGQQHVLFIGICVVLVALVLAAAPGPPHPAYCATPPVPPPLPVPGYPSTICWT